MLQYQLGRSLNRPFSNASLAAVHLDPRGAAQEVLHTNYDPIGPTTVLEADDHSKWTAGRVYVRRSRRLAVERDRPCGRQSLWEKHDEGEEYLFALSPPVSVQHAHPPGNRGID